MDFWNSRDFRNKAKAIEGYSNLIFLQQYESKTTYTNFAFYNNTLVHPYAGGNVITSTMTGLSGLTFVNNLAYAPGATISYSFLPASDVTVGNNLWSSSPPSILAGSGDVTSTTPGLASPAYTPTIGGGFDPTSIQLVAGSPASGAGQHVALVTTDYFGTARPAGAYDIGAYQH